MTTALTARGHLLCALGLLLVYLSDQLRIAADSVFREVEEGGA